MADERNRLKVLLPKEIKKALNKNGLQNSVQD